MPRKNRNAAEVKALIEKYYQVSQEVSKLEFCRQEKISDSCFYRYLDKYKPENLTCAKKPLGPVPKFIEVQSESKQVLQSPKRQILVKLFGLKLFNLELEYV